MGNDALKKLMIKESTPLEEALEPQELVEYSEEHLELVEMNIPKGAIEGWITLQKNAKDPLETFTSKGNLTEDAFNYLLIQNCTAGQLSKIIVNKLTKKQQKAIDKRIEEGGVPDLEDQHSLIERYIDKNKELLKEKDELFKKIMQLQEERDKYKSACKELITLFKKHKIEDNISNENYPTINQLLKDVKK